jgi:DNA polymerase III delta subunit
MINNIPAAYTALSKLEKPYPRFALQAKDDFFREDLLEKYLGVCRGHFSKNAIVEISAAELSSNSQILLERSLFETKKLWIIDKTSLLKGKKPAELMEIVEQSDDYFLFIDADTIPKAIVSASQAIVLPPIKPWDRPPLILSWIRSYCKKEGKEISKEAAQLLALSLSESRQMLVQEIEKISLYCLEREEISVKDVEAIATIDVHSTVWQLLDSLLQKDRKGLLHAVEHLDDMQDIALIRFIKSQLQKLVIASLGTAPMPSKTQEKRRDLVRRRGVDQIISLVNRLEMEDLAIRSGTDLTPPLDLLLSWC